MTYQAIQDRVTQLGLNDCFIIDILGGCVALIPFDGNAFWQKVEREDIQNLELIDKKLVLTGKQTLTTYDIYTITLR